MGGGVGVSVKMTLSVRQPVSERPLILESAIYSIGATESEFYIGGLYCANSLRANLTD